MRKRAINIKQLDTNLSTLPELCYALIEDFTGENETQIGVIKRGVSGYFPYRADLSDKSAAAAQAFVDRQNERLEVTPAQVKAMKFGSMFGWDTPGADPEHPANQPRQLVD